MKNQIICDTTTMMMMNMLREHEAVEPPDLDAEVHVSDEAALIAKRRYEWERLHSANILMLSARLIGLAREQL